MMKRLMWVLSAAMVLMAVVLAGCGGGGGDSSSSDGGSTTTYKVSGALTANGAGLAGVTVSSGNASATTDASGNLRLTPLPTVAVPLLRPWLAIPLPRQP